MSEPVWIDSADALAIHAELLSRFGGLEGVRDPGMLESALARPKNLFAYGELSLFPMAAAYGAGIVNNHPFSDGNKRTGFTVAVVFLEANGLSFVAPEEEAVLQTLALAAGELSEEDYGRWLAASCAPPEPESAADPA